MTHKIQLEFTQHTTADEVLDQIVYARLRQIREQQHYYGDDEIVAACKVLLDWMGKPDAQD